MDLTLTRQPLYISETILDTTAEQPVECDALLPDYCPDIARVLRCEMSPSVNTRRVSGMTLTAEGMTRLSVLYAAADGTPARVEYKVPFSRSFELRGDASGGTVEVTAQPGYCNCRAVGGRRLDMRGAVNLTARAAASREAQAVSAARGLGVQLKTQSVSATRPAGQASRETSIDEVLQLPEGKPPIAAVLRVGSTARVIECKAVAGKAMVRGQLDLRILYRAEDGSWAKADFVIPTSAVVELPGLNEDCRCAVRQSVLALSAEPITGEDGANDTIKLEAVIDSTVTAWQDYRADVAVDCYSTRHPCGCHMGQLNVTEDCRMVSESVSHRETYPLPENMESIIDVWREVSSWKLRSDPEGAAAEIKLVICMLGRMRGGEVFCFDRYADIEKKLPADCGEMGPEITCTDWSWTEASPDSIDLRCEVEINGVACRAGRISVIDEITVDAKKQKDGIIAPGLYIYMCSDDETLWDIAKRYNTDAGRIAEENDSRTAGPLLIPVL